MHSTLHCFLSILRYEQDRFTWKIAFPTHIPLHITVPGVLFVMPVASYRLVPSFRLENKENGNYREPSACLGLHIGMLYAICYRTGQLQLGVILFGSRVSCCMHFSMEVK